MYKKGTIVLIPFPFTDLSGSKVRPALILYSATKSIDIVVVFITSQIKNLTQFEVPIKPTPSNGLKVPSIIVCNKIASLDAKIVLGKLGFSDSNIVESVNCELRKVFAL